MEKAFVLGGSGYLGSQLIEELDLAGFKISALVHKTPINQNKGRIKTVTGSLTDFDWTRLEGDLPDVIFHSARMSGADKKSRLKAAQSNKLANKRMISWLQKHENPPLLVYVSGTLVYGSHGSEPVDESHLPQPISFQKQYFEAERPILEAMRNQQLPVIIVRPSWIYGPGSWFQAFYLNYINKKQKVPVYGKGDNLMAFIHVRDCAAMIIHVARHGIKNEVFNLYTESAITQKTFAHFLAENANLSLRQIPLWWLSLRFDRAVSEAFHFSLNLSTYHHRIWQQFTPYYPSIKSWIQNVFENNNTTY